MSAEPATGRRAEGAALQTARPILEELLNGPVVLEELKRKRGRRVTLRAVGPRGSAVVKVYASDRAPTVAARLSALAPGPPEPLVPRLLCVRPQLGLLVLSYLPGSPLRVPVLRSDLDACRRAGASLEAWHRFWGSAPKPDALVRHTAQRELDLLAARANLAPGGISRRALALALPLATAPWSCSTAVHRDLYEEQVLIGDRVALIDLDDAALGPPELDLGNLVAHVELLGARSGRSLTAAVEALLRGYRANGGSLDGGLLERCRRLALLRLACIHEESWLIDAAQGSIR